MDARKKTTVAVKKAQGWLTITSTKTRTVATIRLELSRLGKLYIAKVLLIYLAAWYQSAEVLLLLSIAPAARIRATAEASRIKPPAMKGPGSNCCNVDAISGKIMPGSTSTISGAARAIVRTPVSKAESSTRRRR